MVEGSKSCNLGKGTPNPETTGSGNCCCNPEEHLTMATTDLLLLLLLLFGSRLCHLFFALKHILPPSTQTCLTGGAPQTKYAEGGLCKTSEIATGDPTRAGICSHNSSPNSTPQQTNRCSNFRGLLQHYFKHVDSRAWKRWGIHSNKTKQRRLFFSFLSLPFFFFFFFFVAGVVVVVVSLLHLFLTT